MKDPEPNLPDVGMPQSVSQPPSLLAILVWSAGLAVMLCGIAVALHGKTGLEKTLTLLTFPVGAIWLGLSGWTLHTLSTSLRHRESLRGVWLPMLLWFVFSLCGSPLLADACYAYLERLETPYNAAVDPPLDLLIVLGGSTTQGPTRAEVTDCGDRVVLAAQLYQQGHVSRLIATGSDLPHGFGGQTSPAAQTLEILTSVGVPATRIEKIPGINTYAEMQSLKQHFAELARTSGVPSRIGLLTSAWHLPRAMRLARAAGLPELIPVAADHKSGGQIRWFFDLIPAAKHFQRLERCQREFMASWVQR